LSGQEELLAALAQNVGGMRSADRWLHEHWLQRRDFEGTLAQKTKKAAE
jgi:hypothetical protein